MTEMLGSQFRITAQTHLKTVFCLCVQKCLLSCVSPYNVMYVLTEPDGDVIVVIWSFNQNVFSALVLIHSSVCGIVPPIFLSYYVLSPTLPVKFRTHFWTCRGSSWHPYLALLSACIFSANERTQFCQVSECFLEQWGFGTCSKWWL